MSDYMPKCATCKHFESCIMQKHNTEMALILWNIDREKEKTVNKSKGKWIDKGWKGDWQFETDGRGNCWHEYECSECGFHNKGGKSNFCPDCGADMRGMEDK